VPKKQYIDPVREREAGYIRFGKIPVNQYNKTITEEMQVFSKDDLIRIYRDMVIIREFETMLNRVKTTGEYNNVQYNHPGPAHLSIGQEAAAVGMAYALTIEDLIFGSHRSHGEILAKGLSAIHQSGEDQLVDIMTEYFDGRILAIVEDGFKGNSKELAIRFLLYGTLAEIFARETGFNKGLGGSMHAFFPPFGIYPNNAIVGGSGDISVGAALYKKVNQKPGIVVANIGDASMGCGPVWEGISFASMDQFHTLWEGDFKGGLPILFNFMNNQYGMGGQTRGETMGYDILARVGAGVNPEMMHSERVDGYNPLAVIDAFKRKKEILEAKKGPVLLDTLTYRISGHSPSDASSYRSKEEIEAWKKIDSIHTFGEQIIEAKVASKHDLEAIQASIQDHITRIMILATDDEKSPRMNLLKDPNAIGELMFSNGSVDAFENRKPAVNHQLVDNPRVKQISMKERFGLDANGKPHSKVKTFQLRDGIFEAIIDRFYKDPTLVAFGEENRDWGGAFGVYRGLTECLPYHRLFNSPISEGAIAGTAIGYALSGGRCSIGTTGNYVWSAVPAGNLYFLIVGTNGVGMESSWGTDSDLNERKGPSASGLCLVSSKNTTVTCP